MRARYRDRARTLASSAFLLSVCVLLPIVFFRVVAAAVSGTTGPII